MYLCFKGRQLFTIGKLRMLHLSINKFDRREHDVYLAFYLQYGML
jgi:hypothetical protein